MQGSSFDNVFLGVFDSISVRVRYARQLLLSMSSDEQAVSQSEFPRSISETGCSKGIGSEGWFFA
jgi:hypothetical protein